MEKTHEDCIAYLEKIRWSGKPICPYCESTNSTYMKKELRYHCNFCFTSYSVTVGTLFHRTHIDLSKWFLAIAVVLNSSQDTSVRQLAKKVGVSKNTAASMLLRINKAVREEQELILAILKWINS